MKYTKSISVLFALIFVACSQEDIPFFSITTSPKEAPIYVDGYSSKCFITDNENTSHIVSREMASRFVSVTFPEQTAKQIIPVKQDNSTVLWVVNFNKGWVMLSGDTRAPIILAENSLGSYNPQYDNNPARTAWIEGYKQIVLDVRNGKRIPGEESEAVWRICSPEKRQRPFTKSIDDPVWVRSTISSSMTYVSSSNFVPHLISTKWGQGAPWNSNVPYYYDNNSSLRRFPVGCTAVAIGQILYYFHETYNVPTGLYETVNNSHYLPLGGYNIFFSHSNFVTQSSRWEDMPVDSTSLGYPEYVSDLLGDIGHSVNMDYGITGSGAWQTTNYCFGNGLSRYMYSGIRVL